MTGSYFGVIKANPERYALELIRVKTILNDRYKNDPDYREKCKERARIRRLKIKEEKNDLKI